MSDECMVTIFKSQSLNLSSSKQNKIKPGVRPEVSKLKFEEVLSEEKDLDDPHIKYGLVLVFCATIVTLAMLIGYLFIYSKIL